MSRGRGLGRRNRPPEASAIFIRTSVRRGRVTRRRALVLGAVLLLGIVVLVTPSPRPSGRLNGLSRPGFRARPLLALPLLARGSFAPRRADLWRAALTDGRLDLGELRGAPVVVNFWASWCTACVLEAPALSNAAKGYGRRGVFFVGVNQEDSIPQARRFLRDLHVRYPNVRESGSATARRWQVSGYPTTFFISARGKVVAKVVGRASRSQLGAGIARALTPPNRRK